MNDASRPPQSCGQVAHNVVKIDIQPGTSANALIIFVTGHIKVGGADANPIHFCQCFQLVASAPGSYYIHNDIFRLNYA